MRLGVVQLCILVVFAMLGMLIMQQNVEGFDAYYVSLTPAERLVYGALGLFDIYHSWYFNLAAADPVAEYRAGVDRPLPFGMELYCQTEDLTAHAIGCSHDSEHATIPMAGPDESTSRRK